VSTRGLGAGVAEALGDRAVVVLRNHGLAVVGNTIEAAVVLAVSFERSLAIQVAAAQLGSMAPMSADEAAALAQSLDATGPERIGQLYRALRSAHDKSA
jgi:ribulose-5-phosphate 4-epimerase/fuculose-1-phosphate aldolase